MIGVYENFPENFHYSKSFTYTPSRGTFQQKLTNLLHEINRSTFTFEDVGSPAVPNSTVIFAFGIADEGKFNFLNEAETKKVTETIGKNGLHVMDVLCAIRYYKNQNGKKAPLRFDYFLLRLVFDREKNAEFQVFHERGPRYIAPEELVTFLADKINNAATPRKILKPTEPP
ncbi:MAG: hypothetical protein N3D85_00140 [Candidatus Bathyarchaeota archaeon]|nr:hypothetical protein [Candidatus Bathyarchaeota archaeon]